MRESIQCGGPEIESTDLCKALIKEFDIEILANGEICEPFINEIEALFERNGVSWSDTPLIELGSGMPAQG